MKSFRLIFVLLAINCIPICASQPSDGLECVERPKVALVLSGGGARGAAHVGVIRLIEELQIPVDIVTGTSMGAIVGALYAIGYTADEMDSLMMTRDWKLLLSNGVPRKVQPFALRENERHYQITVPYADNVRTEANARYRDAGIKVRRSSEKTFPKVLARPGLIDGQNLMNEFTELTIAFNDSMDYSALPRPYACVATDLVTGEAVVLSHGFLAESMRASMSIPGVFYPIYRDSMVLVDGGVVNNYPVDVARAMGADIVIGVDLSAGTSDMYTLRTFPSIFERLISTMGASLRRRNIADTDVLIRPQVGTFPVMGFDTVRLRKMIELGYAAASLSKAQLEGVREALAVCSSEGAGQEIVKDVPPQFAHPHPLNSLDTLSIREVVVSGADRGMMLSLLDQYGVCVDVPFPVDVLSQAVESIYGLGTFSSVQYHLIGSDPYTLRLEVVPNPENQVELGVRLDSEEAAAALLGLGLNRMALAGPRMDLAAKLSLNPWVEGRIAYAWYDLPQINLAMKYWFSDVNRFVKKYSHQFNYHFFGADAYLSNLLSRCYDLRLGTRLDHYQVSPIEEVASAIDGYEERDRRLSYIGLYASFRNDLFDAAYLPTSGYAYGFEAMYNRSMNRRDDHFFSMQGNASMALPLGPSTVVQPAAYLRWLWGADIPVVYANCVGGYLPGRYLRQQQPFVGLLGCEFMHRGLAMLRLDVRQSIVSDLYLSAAVNYAYSADAFDSSTATQVLGLGIGMVYNTTVGPLMLGGHWNDLYHRLGAYFSFGYSF